jgi:3-oxoacyl-[acyl-carrier-protein] synthase II
MTDRTPVIVAYDMVSPLGTELDVQWRRAAGGKSGVGPLTRFAVSEDFPVDIAGEVADVDVDAYPFLTARKLALWPSPVFKHALLVVHRALERSGIAITPELAPRVAVTFSTAVGGQDALLHAHRQMVLEDKLPPPWANPNSCINMVGGKISILTGATGPITATITACATGVTSLIVGAMLLEQGRADVAICGAVDFPLVAPIVAGFATMNGAYQKRPGEARKTAARASRPFSVDRRGFVVSEGAGCLIIATREFAAAHGLHVGIELAGWSMTSDAHHYVAPHLDTVARCMAEAVADAGIAPRDIDAVNAHATSTAVGDRVEAEALHQVFGRRIPALVANKSLTGHAMGASSAIESVLAIEGMRRRLLLPTINYRPDPALTLDGLVDRLCDLEQEFVLKNAFGFGGCNACIVFKRTT